MMQPGFRPRATNHSTSLRQTSQGLPMQPQPRNAAISRTKNASAQRSRQNQHSRVKRANFDDGGEEEEAEEGGNEAGNMEGEGDGQDAQQTAEQLAAEEEEKKKRKKKRLHPQQEIAKLWNNFKPEFLGKVTKILPDAVPVSTTPKSKPQISENSHESYLAARAACEKAVDKIVAECHRDNQKYTDAHFDIERDLKDTRNRDCLDPLVGRLEADPSDVRRVTDLFEDPKFYSDGAESDDIVQGALGDCWFLSAIALLTCSKNLIDRVCVKYDQECGVYGFVFFRDGEWHQTIIDDKLYLAIPAFQETTENTYLYIYGKDQEKKYNEDFQTGSRALIFGKCRDQNETWVPLLEKAFAKAHGGYSAIEGGFTGEGVEDLTGGVTTGIYTTDILSKEQFWLDIKKNGIEFVFGASDASTIDWNLGSVRWEDPAWTQRQMRDKRKGVISGHAYCVLGWYEGHGQRLVKLKNPWGKTEFTGAWSDGSEEWTPEWLKRVGHKFGDDGIFWMSYKDFLNGFKAIERTRIFDDSWFTAQKWATVQVPFELLDYQQTKFSIEVPEDTLATIVLSQLNNRYFRDLEGRYDYALQFRISKADDQENYIARSRRGLEMQRSTNIELPLEKGTYIVLIKVDAEDRYRDGVEEVVKACLPYKRDRLITSARLYDLAHQKGLPEVEEDNVAVQEGDKPEDKMEIVETEKTDTKTEDSSQPADTPATTEPGNGQITETIDRDRVVITIDTKAGEEKKDEDEDEEDEKTPWNATCVVGLRVYSKIPDLSVKVIYPPKPVQPVLDRDAITKAPQEEAEKAAEPATEAPAVKEASAEKPEENQEEAEPEPEREADREIPTSNTNRSESSRTVPVRGGHHRHHGKHMQQAQAQRGGRHQQIRRQQVEEDTETAEDSEE